MLQTIVNCDKKEQAHRQWPRSAWENGSDVTVGVNGLRQQWEPEPAYSTDSKTECSRNVQLKLRQKANWLSQLHPRTWTCAWEGERSGDNHGDWHPMTFLLQQRPLLNECTIDGTVPQGQRGPVWPEQSQNIQRECQNASLSDDPWTCEEPVQRGEGRGVSW